jgi:hypothetical protein
MRTLASHVRTVVLAVVLGACIFVSDDSTLTIHNHSDFVISEVYVAEVDDPTWGPNLLPSDLYPGEDLVIVDIECGTYDVLVVELGGIECELLGLDLCFDDAGWVITNSLLIDCAF